MDEQVTPYDCQRYRAQFAGQRQLRIDQEIDRLQKEKGELIDLLSEAATELRNHGADDGNVVLGRIREWV